MPARHAFVPRRVGGAALLLLGSLLLSSCSGSAALNPVKGKVLLKGQPIKGAVVTFHPKGGNEVTAQRPAGVTGDDGTFALTTGTKDGAPAGDYTVTVLWLKAPEAPKGGKKIVINTEAADADSEDLLKGRYADRARSALTAEVKSGANELQPFALE